MKNKFFIAMMAMAVAAFGFTSCGDDDGGGSGPDYSYLEPYMPGLGDNSGAPTGTAFTLPTGVILQGMLGGYSTGMAFEGDYVPVGSGAGYVTLYADFVNTTPADVVVTLPAGLILLSEDQSAMTGILLQDVIFTVPANDGYYYAKIYAYSVNATKTPSDSHVEYAIGKVTNNPLLSNITSIVEDKMISGNHAVNNVQNIVWNVTEDYDTDEYVGLTSIDRAYLNNLPDAEEN